MNAEYQEYLKSDHWKKLKSKKTKAACAICGFVGPLDVHHLFYRNLYDCTTKDLRKLCRECHDAAHSLQNAGKIKWNKERDNHLSRFSIIKAAVKRLRFGNPGITNAEIAELRMPDIEHISENQY